MSNISTMNGKGFLWGNAHDGTSKLLQITHVGTSNLLLILESVKLLHMFEPVKAMVRGCFFHVLTFAPLKFHLMLYRLWKLSHTNRRILSPLLNKSLDIICPNWVAVLPKVCQIDQPRWALTLNLGIESGQFFVTQLTETFNLN